MKGNFKVIGIIILQLSVYHCSLKNDNFLTTINIESNVKNMEMVNLGSFTDNIRYITLENVENLPLRNLGQIVLSDNHILVADVNNCILFNTEGRFISKIGKNGRGPGEYQIIFNIGLGPGKDQKVYLSSLYDIYEFSINGSFINKYSKSLFFDDNIYLSKWYLINDSLFFGHIPNTIGHVDNKAVIINKHGKIKHEFKNYIFYNNVLGGTGTGGMEKYANIYQFNKSVFYKELFNDTLFYLNDNYELIPKYFFNLGKFKMPPSERAKLFVRWNYISVFDVFQTRNYLFLDCEFGYHFPAKRLTPFYFAPGVEPSWYNTTHVMGLYNKKTGELVFCKPSSTDNPLFTTGLYNDIDCGPRFFPKTIVNDSTMAMWVTADQLKKHVASDDFKNAIPKYQGKKKELEELANRLNIFDNPVLMIVTFLK